MKPFVIKVIHNETKEPLKAVLPTDGNMGMVIGTDQQVRALAEALRNYLETGAHDGTIQETDEQLGHPWLTQESAAALALWMGASIHARVIQRAAQEGRIEGAVKDGRAWRFPKRSFEAWLRNRPRPSRPAKAVG